MLNWQNDQLKLLQEQVSALLQASPQQQQQSNRSTQEYPLIQDGGVRVVKILYLPNGK